MDQPPEPLPPGIVPNFPPSYPLRWSEKLLPQPHPNELRSLGLPTAFSSYGRPQRGYGGYESCHNFRGAHERSMDNEELAKQEDYWEELMLQQTGAQEEVLNQQWHSPWHKGREHGWRGPGPAHHSDFNSVGVYTKRRANSFRGKKYNFRGGASGNMRPYQKCDIHSPSQAAPLGEVFVPSANGNSCEISEEEEAFQQGRFWHSDEYAAFDDDPDWGCNEEAGALGGSHGEFPSSAPVPSSIDHYYNLAPQKLAEKKNTPNSVADREVAIARKLNYLRRQFRDRVCEVCVVGFPRIELYHKHLRSHAKCMYPGCEFEACIEVLDVHITREHLLNPAVNAPISDEEYRRQRRNKFPTKAKKELQQAMVDLQKKRGELLSLKSNRSIDSRAQSSKAGGGGERTVRGTKRSLSNDKLKKPRVEKSLKLTRREQNPHETDENFVVYARIPEFRGTQTFDEEMGVKSCFADAIQNVDAPAADVLAFHISDDDEEVYQPVEREAEASPARQGTASTDHAEYVAGRESCSNTCNEGVLEAHLSCSDGGASRPAAEQTVQGADLPACGALGLLIGDYGSASDSESETVASSKLNLARPVGSATSCDVSGGIQSRCERAVIETGNQSDSDHVDGEHSTRINDQADSANPQPKAGKKNRHRRGKRGLKKHRKVTTSEIVQSDASLDERTVASSPDAECAGVKTSCGSKSILSSPQPGVTAASASTVDVQQSLFPHLKAINSRRCSESSDDDATAVPERKPWHVRSEEALAAKCASQKYRKFRTKYRTSLLEKLLQDEVRFERNVLLQCAKYIVEHKFFDGIKEGKDDDTSQARDQVPSSNGHSSGGSSQVEGKE